MFSNIFDIISTFTVELKVYFLLFYQPNNNKMATCVYMNILLKLILNDDFVENQFQITLIIHRSMEKKFQSLILHSKAIKEGFHFATLKWHRLIDLLPQLGNYNWGPGWVTTFFLVPDVRINRSAS